MTAPQQSPTSPQGYNPRNYPAVALAADLAVFTIRRDALCVLLVERGQEPYQGSWALPGGFVRPAEDATAAAHRELAEETGIEVFPGHLEQLGTYSAPERDPRMRVASVAHVGLVPDLPLPQAGSDAAGAQWWPVQTVLGPDGPPLAFDHERMICDALERVRAKVEYTTLALQFVHEPFTLADLHRVYRIVWGVEPNPANFRRKVISTPGFVQATQDTGEPGSGGGPAPRLYKRGHGARIAPPLTRPR